MYGNNDHSVLHLALAEVVLYVACEFAQFNIIKLFSTRVW